MSDALQALDVARGCDRGAEWLGGALGLDEGQAPFPWQIELLRRFLQTEPVSALDIPTGLGKTATMAVWLVARALGAPLPRRLVYVVDRRVVVDQATEVAESLRAWVEKERTVANALGLGDRALPISTLRGQHVDNREWLEDPSSSAIVVGTVDMVGSRLLFSGYGVSSKMRPYHAGLLGADTLVVLDEAHLIPAFEDLLLQIERGAEAFGSKDPALRTLLPRFTLLSLSATGRQTGSTTLTLTDADRRNLTISRRLTAKKSLTTVDLAGVSEATDNTDENGDNEAADNEKASRKNGVPKLANELAKQAWQLTRQGSAPFRCVVFCDSRKDATAVAGKLRSLAKSASAPAPPVELFVGARRVRERIQARDALARLGFLAGTSVTLERSAFLIATSAGEVGVDLDADHMFCDLVAWERMVQRLGRVNRRGDGNAQIMVVLETEPLASEATKKALEKRNASQDANRELEELKTKLRALQGEKKTVPKGQRKTSEEKAAEETHKRAEKELKALISKSQKRIKAFKDADAKLVMRHEAEVAKQCGLRTLLKAVGEGGSLSPESLLQLRQRRALADAVRDATTVEPLRPELTRALVDAWSLTSLDRHPGRPEIGPWVRGFCPNDPPQTTVVWRRHLPVRNDGSFDAKAAKRFFESAPPHTSELRVQTAVGKRAKLASFFSGHEEDGTPAHGVHSSHLAFAFEPVSRCLLVLAPHLIERRSPTEQERDHLRILDCALEGFRELRAGNAGRLTLSSSVISEERDDSVLSRSRVWETATPYVVTRHAKDVSASEALTADVRAECRRLRLPEPWVEPLNVRGVPGTGLGGDIRLTFRKAVSGPILLGRTRHFGGGLFRPILEQHKP